MQIFKLRHSSAAYYLLTGGFVVYLISSTYCSTNYRVVQDGIELINNSKRLNISVLKIYKYNKTESALMGRMNCSNVRDSRNYTVFIDGYEKFGNEHIYKKSAIQFSVPLCSLLNGKIMFNMGMKEFGNIPEKCSDYNGWRLYTLTDFIVDDRTPLPPEVPGKYWRIDIKLKSDYDIDELYMQYFAHINRNIHRRRNNNKNNNSKPH